MKIYHTKTQEDYDTLMVELDKQGCAWEDGDRLSVFNAWNSLKGDTYIKNDGRLVTYDTIETYERLYPNTPIIEYKADKKGETDDFIKELTVKIYYNEVTKKHYNSYEDAIADCKKEMERQHDKN